MKYVAIGDICHLVRGSSPRPKGDLRYYNGNVPRLMVADVTRDGMYVAPSIDSLTEEGAKLSRPMKKGEVVMAVSGKPGVPAILNVDACIHDGFVGFRKLNKSLTPQFLYYVLFNIAETSSSQSVGAIFKNLNTDQIKQFKIPFPSLDIQQKIATVLDKANQLRQKRKQAIEKLDQLIQSVFLDMFGDPRTNTKKWKSFKLQDVCKKITDGTHFSPPPQSKGIPYITAKHIKSWGIDFDRAPTFVSEEDHREIYKRCDPTKGDVLYIKDGATTGVAAINHYPFEFSMLSSLALLRANDKVITQEYLCYWLNNPLVKQLMLEKISGAAIKRLTLIKIKNSKINVPPIAMQHLFSNKVIHIIKTKGGLYNSAKKVDNIFNSLLQRAFKGELKFNDKAFKDLE